MLTTTCFASAPVAGADRWPHVATLRALRSRLLVSAALAKDRPADVAQARRMRVLIAAIVGLLVWAGPLRSLRADNAPRYLREPSGWTWNEIPKLRLALGPGWGVPSAEVVTDLALSLAVGMVARPSRSDDERYFFLAPELAYSFRRFALGDEHAFNAGLGLGLQVNTLFSLAYIPAFVVGRRPVSRGDRLTDEAVVGLRHGLRLMFLSSILSLELSHQVVTVPSPAYALHDLRLCLGLDIGMLIYGVAMVAYWNSH